jgi:predicted CoA-binding protein
MVDEDKSFKTLSELPEKPQAIDMVINPIKGGAYVVEANNLNIEYVWFQPGAESKELIEKSNSYGMNVVYNNCVMVEFK